MEEKPSKPRREGNHYIPPPARKQGVELQDFSRLKERATKSIGQKQGKLCDDSSLLFKDSSSKLEEKTKVKRKHKRSNKKANAENNSVPIAPETQPALPPYSDSEKAIYQRVLPHDVCESLEKAKSHLPLNDLENTRTGKSMNLDTQVKLVGEPNNSSRLVVIPCGVPPCLENELKPNECNESEIRADVYERRGCDSKVAVDDVPNSLVSEIQHLALNGAEIRDNSAVVPSENRTGSIENITIDSELNYKIVPESEDRLTKPCPISERETKTVKLKFQETPSSSLAFASSKKGQLAYLECSSSSVDLSSAEDGDWDSIYDDSGNYLIPQSASPFPKELKSQVESDLAKTPKVSPKQPVAEKTFENCSSVIEIYGFSEDLKTNDLLAVFGSFINRGFNLKWVDNTHALGIFPSPFLAEEALSYNLPLVKTRPIALGTPLSQERAKTLVLPSSLRPKTCSALARRLVSGALGLRVKSTPEERAAERELLREAREKKKLILKQRDAAWEGNFSSSDGCEEK